MKAETSDNPVDQLTIPVLADQHVRPAAPVCQRHHELAAMPKRKDDRGALAVKLLDDFHALHSHAHRHPQEPDDTRPQGRNEYELTAIDHVLTRDSRFQNP